MIFGDKVRHQYFEEDQEIPFDMQEHSRFIKSLDELLAKIHQNLGLL